MARIASAANFASGRHRRRRGDLDVGRVDVREIALAMAGAVLAFRAAYPAW
ncbi:hypothetical protein [Sorangium sp. So ce542]|uniref:hypothetical protein n=1 Tax=Sorangium sp. So ce542 TaxID=3133316 RepID=UPI003F643267